MFLFEAGNLDKAESKIVLSRFLYPLYRNGMRSINFKSSLLTSESVLLRFLERFDFLAELSLENELLLTELPPF